MRKINLLKISGYLVYFALLCSMISIAPEVHIIPLSIFMVSVLLGFVLDRKQNQSPLVNPYILFLLVGAGVIISLIGMTYGNLFSRVLAILLIIISAKLISPKKERDMLQIYLLNFFLMTGSAVTRLDLEFGLMVLGQTYIFLLGLVLIYGSGEQEEMLSSHLWKLAGWSGVVTTALIPATIILFLIIPRPTMTLFAWGGGVVSGSGFSDTVTPGAVEQIKLDNAPAFRVRWLEGEKPEHIMWRGLVYDSYYEGSWERVYKEDILAPVSGNSIAAYEVILEPTDTKYLFSAGVPFQVKGRSLSIAIKPGYTIELRRNRNQRIIYQVHSFLTEEIPMDLDPGLYLAVPDDLHEELKGFAKDMITDSDYDTCLKVQDFLSDNFDYDLSPGKPSGDPVLYFLNESRNGHCEYFASAMTLILRSVNIPARMVGGYQEGEWNGLGGYYLVRQKDAHTWVEAWIKGRGWVVFDPTPPSPIAHGQAFKSRLFRFVDLLRLRWYYWVIDYNMNKQMDLARMTRGFFRSLKRGDSRVDLVKSLPEPKTVIYPAAAVVLLIFLTTGYRLYKNRPKGWGERFALLMKKNGYERKSGQTIMELASSVSHETPRIREKAIQFSEKYYGLEYGRLGNKDELKIIYGELKNEMKDMDSRSQ